MDAVEHRVVRLEAEVFDHAGVDRAVELEGPLEGQGADECDDRLLRAQEPRDRLPFELMSAGREGSLENLRGGRLRAEQGAPYVEEDVRHVAENVDLAGHNAAHRFPGGKPCRFPFTCGCLAVVEAKLVPKDPAWTYFAGTDRDRAAFEAGIKLGAVAHQFVGAPVTEKNAGDLEKAIEAATRVQPLVSDVRVKIDRSRIHARGPYAYASLTEDMLRVTVTIRVGKIHATAEMQYIPELDYPLMYLKEVGESAKS